jgi:MoxR-like ATPase
VSWSYRPDEEDSWCSAEASAEILGGVHDKVPPEWRDTCRQRLTDLRRELHSSYVGLDETIDMLLAAVVARENALLLGPPGTAKSELPTRLFELLGLEQPSIDTDLLKKGIGTTDPYGDWRHREEAERRQQKYFHYLLSRFTQPEELFGPVEISLLRNGMLVRVNFGMLTGPGVRAAFLDEIFKASSNILNTLLTLSQERKYFNWGEMRTADLNILIGASNEMPGGFGSGVFGVGSGQDDFQTLHAFIDRFPARLLIIPPSASDVADVTQSSLARAFDKAFGREAERFHSGSHFGSKLPAGMPSINDMLCLGRAMMEDVDSGDGFFDRKQEQTFRTNFLNAVHSLQQAATNPERGEITWTISPRKLRALYKIALAHALVRGEPGPNPQRQVELSAPDLRVFATIWDAPHALSDLKNRVAGFVNNYIT